MEQKSFVMPESARAKVENIVSSTRSAVVDSELMPIATIFKGNEVKVVATPFRNQDEKVATARMLKTMVEGADLFVYVLESWVKQMSELESRRHMKNPSDVSQLPGAREVVIFMVESPEFSVMASVNILSENGKRKLDDAPVEWHQSHEGLFPGILYKGVKR